MSRSYDMQVKITGFDYSHLDSETAGKLQYYANSGRTLVRRNMIRFIAEFGEILSESRKLLSKHGDGTFCKWAESEFDLSRQTVYNYVNSWERCLSNGWTNFDHLSPTALYLMCRDDTPKPVRDKVLQLAKKQPAITKSDVDALLDRGGPERTTKPSSTPKRDPKPAPDPFDAANREIGGEADPFEETDDESGEDGRTDSDGTDAQEPTTRPPRKGKEKPSGPITASPEQAPAYYAREQVKIWADTIGRWLQQSPSIDEYRGQWAGPRGDRVVKAATELFEALKLWGKEIK
ncbi:MAG: hypothetical protein U9Q82_08090 [Chloroflexota bacterium]|nr:hypothetical protein [Chloroflexota bacterium]